MLGDQAILAPATHHRHLDHAAPQLWEGLTDQLSQGWGWVEEINALNQDKPGHGDDNEGLGNMAADYYASWILNQTDVRPFAREFPLKHLVSEMIQDVSCLCHFS